VLIKNIKIICKVKLLAFFLILTSSAVSQVVTEIGNVSEGSSSVVLSLSHRFQKYKSSGLHENDHYDRSINSPKSVKIIDAKKKFYIHSLEGYTTSVYSLENFKLLKTIKHKFQHTNKALFQDTFYFKQNFRTKSSDWNTFKGKPVESCLSHNGKYLWVTYYRRSYDANAIDPSAVCIIDTDSDSIVRVIPTGPLPKMITCSPDNKHIAISHWGNNTVALIDIQGNNPKEFHYVTELLVDKKMSLDYGQDEKIDRDQGCGACLRGTVFTTD
jgi:DNA-binding beta-propeller fold protein YncE